MSNEKNRLDINNYTKEDKTELMKHNIIIIVIYSLFLAIAFSLNNLFTSIFIKISGKDPGILFKFLYFIILIIVVVIITYIANIKIKL
jgi:hypothetical protein